MSPEQIPIFWASLFDVAHMALVTHRRNMATHTTVGLRNFGTKMFYLLLGIQGGPKMNATAELRKKSCKIVLNTANEVRFFVELKCRTRNYVIILSVLNILCMT